MINRLVNGWSFSRLIRLALGIVVGIQGIMLHEYLLSVLGFFIALLALFGFSTCGSSACVQQNKTTSNKHSFSNKRIDYEKLDLTK